MDKYEELERLYYKKKYLKIFKNFIILVIALSIGIVVYLQNKKDDISSPKKTIHHQEINETKIIKKDKNKTKIQKQTVKKIQAIKKIKPEIQKLTLYPIFPDITKEDKNIHVKSKKYSQPEIKHIVKKKIEKPKPIKKPEIKIIIKTQTEDVSNLITSYNISPNYTQAMQIANIYFKKRNYQQSINWSKKANKINPEKSQSWYLFAKNLIELDKKKKAKEVLSVYLNTYGPNDKIEKLLRSLK